MGFSIYKNMSVLTIYNKTTTGFFVDYEKEKIYNIYEKYYPTFSYEINGSRYTNFTDTPVFFRMHKPEDEKEIKLLYNESNPNHIIVKSQVIWNVIRCYNCFSIDINYYNIIYKILFEI